MKMKKQFIQGAAVLSITLLSQALNAATVEINQSVESNHNLYHTDWGHWFTAEADNALGIYNASSAAAQSVAYNFGGIGSITVEATGSVIDAGPYATGPNGCPSVSDPCWFNDGNYFGETAYSVIGLWSTTADSITPILTETEFAGGNTQDDFFDAVFFVGSGGLFTVPDVENAFLFLAENDGILWDNSGQYDVTISFETAVVPLPGAAGLLFSALAGLSWMGRFKSKRS